MQNVKCKLNVIFMVQKEQFVSRYEIGSEKAEIVMNLSYWVFTIGGRSAKINTVGEDRFFGAKLVRKGPFSPLQHVITE
ncbi:hypothetical protein OCV66_11230 [Agathobaculum ammoniilyticum]|uniref:Uncharacterized protein n=1 Tax=Agathobaculum ammoniilyticum TaxID=2981778 RepID=A0ABT2U585_9FIRM|nr:hypothetical protein [Agathobaculum ammoniilyticum]